MSPGRSGSLPRVLELDRAIALGHVELGRLDGRQLHGRQADDVKHRLLGGAEMQLLTGVGLDRGQPAERETADRRGAGEDDDQAPGTLAGGRPRRPRIDLDHLDPEGALGERTEGLALHAGHAGHGQPVEVRGIEDDDVVVAWAGEPDRPALAPRLAPLLARRPPRGGSAPAARRHAEAGGAAELQHQLQALARLRVAQRVVLWAVGLALREVADLALVQDALLAQVHVAHQGQADLFEGVPVPRHVEVRFLAAEDVAVVLGRVGLIPHEQVIEGHRSLRVVLVKGGFIEQGELHLGPPSGSQYLPVEVRLRGQALRYTQVPGATFLYLSVDPGRQANEWRLPSATRRLEHRQSPPR